MNLVKFNQYPTFTDLLENIERNFLGRVDENSGDIPAVNIKEENDKFVLEMAAPGMKKDDFKINLDNYQLTISAETRDEKKEKEDNYTRREFVYNSFTTVSVVRSHCPNSLILRRLKQITGTVF